MMDGAVQLASFSEEQKDAVRQVVRKRLELHNIPFQLLNRTETKKKPSKVEKSRSPAPTLQGGCCFGIRLESISHKELVEIAPGCSVLVPRVLVNMVQFLDDHREAEGIFRISGTNRRLKILRNTICQQRIVEDPARPVNPHDVACLLKHFFREIPGLLLARDCLSDMMTAAGRYDADDEKLQSTLMDLCLLLPELNLATLRYAATFFNRVAADSPKNKMPVENLACVLTPNLMGPAGPGLVLTRQTKVVGFLLANAGEIGFVSRERAVAAQKLTHDNLRFTKSSDRQLRSANKKRANDTDVQDRKPLGSINNFVSSIATRLANTRRATMSSAAGRRMTLGTVTSTSTSSTSTDRTALCMPRSPMQPTTSCSQMSNEAMTSSRSGTQTAPATVTSATRHSVDVMVDVMQQVSCAKRRVLGHELSPPAKVHGEGRFKVPNVFTSTKSGRTRAGKATSLPYIRHPSMKFSSRACSSNIPHRVLYSGATHAFDMTHGHQLAPEISDQENMLQDLESPCDSSEHLNVNGNVSGGAGASRLAVIRAAAQPQNSPHHSFLDYNGDAENPGSLDQCNTIARLLGRCTPPATVAAVAAVDSSFQPRHRSAQKAISAPSQFAIRDTVKCPVAKPSGTACVLDVSDISIHLPSLSADTTFTLPSPTMLIETPNVTPPESAHSVAHLV